MTMIVVMVIIITIISVWLIYMSHVEMTDAEVE